MTIPYIDADTMARVLDYPALVDALDTGHREGVDAVDRTLLEMPHLDGGGDAFLIWPA